MSRNARGNTDFDDEDGVNRFRPIDTSVSWLLALLATLGVLICVGVFLFVQQWCQYARMLPDTYEPGDQLPPYLEDSFTLGRDRIFFHGLTVTFPAQLVHRPLMVQSNCSNSFHEMTVTDYNESNNAVIRIIHSRFDCTSNMRGIKIARLLETGDLRVVDYHWAIYAVYWFNLFFCLLGSFITIIKTRINRTSCLPS